MQKLQKKHLIVFMPFIGVGGVEKNLFTITNFLSEKIDNISVCTVSKRFKSKFSKKIKLISPKMSVSEKTNIRIKYLICLYLLFKLFLKNRNYLLFSFQANIYCILLCKLFNIKVIVRSNSSPSGWYHNSFKKFIYKKIIKLADTIIVNSMDFKREMERKFSIKTICIYNPLNINEIKRKSKIPSRLNFFRNKHFKIINIGRFTNQKDQITILRAANELKKIIEFRLLIIGRGEEKTNLKKFIKVNSLNKCVKIINIQKNPYNFIKQSDVFVLSSKYEGLPNVLLEASALNKFIISTDCPTGPREILSNGSVGLLFKIGDYEGLTKKILLYLKNKKKFNHKIKKNKNFLDKYNFYKNLEKYLFIVKRNLD